MIGVEHGAAGDGEFESGKVQVEVAGSTELYFGVGLLLSFGYSL